MEFGTVAVVHSDGTTTLDLPGGGIVRVVGSGFAVGDNVFYRAGAIVAEAPALPTHWVTV